MKTPPYTISEPDWDAMKKNCTCEKECNKNCTTCQKIHEESLLIKDNPICKTCSRMYDVTEGCTYCLGNIFYSGMCGKVKQYTKCLKMYNSKEEMIDDINFIKDWRCLSFPMNMIATTPWDRMLIGNISIKFFKNINEKDIKQE
jgi:hypothetical protein